MPEGDLKAFGLNYSEGVHESDATLNEKQLGITPEEDSPIQKLADIEAETETVAEESPTTTSAQDDADDSDELDYDLLLDQYAGLAPVESEDEEEEPAALSASEQQLREAYAKQAGRLEALEERIKDRPQPVEQEQEEPDDEGPDYSDPRVQAVLAEAFSDPARIGPTMKVLIETEAQRLIKQQMGPMAEQLGTYQARVEDQEKRTEASAKINAGLQHAYQMGGIEAAIVRQAQKHGPDSMLVQYLKKNPALATSSEGIVSAVMTVARAVQLQEGQSETLPSEQPSPAAPSLTSGNRPTTSSKRGRKISKPTEKKPVEQEMRDMIRNSKRQSASLDFMR
jgi:hypothetical protein